jgi:hypothetical protein
MSPSLAEINLNQIIVIAISSAPATVTALAHLVRAFKSRLGQDGCS